MARPCTVCAHPDRSRIDGMLANRASIAAVSRTFGLSESAVRRHVGAGHNETGALVVATLNRRLAEVSAEGIVGEMLVHYERCLTLLDEATNGESWEPKDRVALLKEVRQSIEGMARIGVKLSKESREVEEHEAKRPELEAKLIAALDRSRDRAEVRAAERRGEVVDAEVVSVGEVIPDRPREGTIAHVVNQAE